jgi:hypothetical protein
MILLSSLRELLSADIYIFLNILILIYICSKETSRVLYEKNAL